MEEHNIDQETLLRHLLTTENCATNDEFLYSVLLGFRLFLSPRQLLAELSRISSEAETSARLKTSTDNVCSQCDDNQTNISDVKLPRTSALYPSQPTDYRPQKTVTITFNKKQDGASNTPSDGDDTLRRKRRGRRRNQLDAVAEGGDKAGNGPKVDRSSTDSGILSETWDYEDSSDKRDASAKNNEDVCARKQKLVHVLHEWVRHFPADFRNKKIMWALNDVIKNCQHEGEDVSTACTQVVDCVSRLTAAQESYEQRLTDMDTGVFVKKTNKFRKTTDWMLNLVLKMNDSLDVTEMAQQLCLVETDFLRHVGAEEFLQLFTADGDEDSKTNLGACVRWFNRLSHLVATVICLCRKHKQAKQVITFFSRVAHRCFELSNFNSSMAILSGLNLGPVSRLKKAWDKLVLPELDKLQSIFDPSNNFLKYRSIYLSRVDELHTSPAPHKRKTADPLNRFSDSSQRSVTSTRSAASQQGDSGVECDNIPKSRGKNSASFKFQDSMKHFTFDPSRAPQDAVMVPFLVLLVKDVYFLNHSIETMDKNGTINYEKLHTLSNILRPLEEWKQMTSTYRKHDDIHDFLLRSPVNDDNDLYLLSYKREPPTNRFEKQQLKTLKAQQSVKKRSVSAHV